MRMTWNQMQVNIQKAVEKVGYELIADRPASTHPDDWYLRVVIGHREEGDSYATWMYNADSNGLFHGHYDLTNSEANEDFLSRS